MEPPTQQGTLRLYLALRDHRPVWAGSLLLGVGLSGFGCELALACLAAGGAGLFLEEDAAALRHAQRGGCVTFVVTTLQEAIRILKNEIRQGRAIAVALRGEPAAALEEAVRRGLQPEALSLSRVPSQAEQVLLEQLRQRGAELLPGLPVEQVPQGWFIATETASSWAERLQRDRELLTAAEGQPLAVDWLRVAPGLFPRALDRAYLARLA